MYSLLDRFLQKRPSLTKQKGIFGEIQVDLQERFVGSTILQDQADAPKYHQHLHRADSKGFYWPSCWVLLLLYRYGSLCIRRLGLSLIFHHNDYNMPAANDSYATKTTPTWHHGGWGGGRCDVRVQRRWRGEERESGCACNERDPVPCVTATAALRRINNLTVRRDEESVLSPPPPHPQGWGWGGGKGTFLFLARIATTTASPCHPPG